MEKHIEIPEFLPPGDYIFSIKNLCPFLGLTPPTVRKMMDRGEIPYLKVSGKFYFEKSQVKAALLKGGRR